MIYGVEIREKMYLESRENYSNKGEKKTFSWSLNTCRTNILSHSYQAPRID